MKTTFGGKLMRPIPVLFAIAALGLCGNVSAPDNKKPKRDESESSGAGLSSRNAGTKANDWKGNERQPKAYRALKPLGGPLTAFRGSKSLQPAPLLNSVVRPLGDSTIPFIIPAHNEEHRLGRTLDDVQRRLPTRC